MRNIKAKLISLLKITVLFFISSSLLWNCEKKEIITTEKTDFTINEKAKKINLKDIPNVINFIETTTKQSPYKEQNFNKFNNMCGIIDYTKIIKTIKDGNKESYTFFFLKPTKLKTFYNFVVQKNEYGKFSASIFEYEPIIPFNPSKDKITLFKGRVKVYDYNNFCSSNYYNQKSTSKPCYEFNLNLNSAGTSGLDSYNTDNQDVTNTNTNSDINTNSGGFVGYTVCSKVVNWRCEAGGTKAHLPEVCGAGTGVPFITLENCKVVYAKGENNCVTLDGNFPISIGSILMEIGKALNLTEKQINWLNNSSNLEATSNIYSFLKSNIDANGDYTSLSKNWAKGQIELGIFANQFSETPKPGKITLRYSPGKINGRDDQKYTHFGHHNSISYYKMEDKSTVISSPSILWLNKDGNLVGNFTTEVSNTRYWYIKPAGSSLWSNYLIKESGSLADDLETLFKLAARDLAVSIGTYVVPAEDIKIIFTGKDFEGQPTSRWLAAGLLLVEVVPGGKILKAVKIVPNKDKVWRIVVKEGDKTYTKVIRELSYEVKQKINLYTDMPVNEVDKLLRTGKYSDDVINEVAEIVEDLYSKKKRKLTWPEVKALFKRGNDFNKKARDNRWYRFHEIHLANEKRLDSYDDIAKEIISRKATDLGNIKFATFEKYLKEFTQKYKVGTKIRSNKYLKELDGKLLEGTYVLEIPNTNKNLPNIQEYIDYAWRNYKVKIRFRPE